MSCPICRKRPPKRFCPAQGEKICAQCCGREREVTIDCPLDCAHLLAAHRYENEHAQPLSADDYPYKDVDFSIEFVYQHWSLVGGMVQAILEFYAAHRELGDRDVLAAIERLGETYRTLGTGLYYERPPEAPLPLALYRQISRWLEEFQQTAASQTGSLSLKHNEVFHILVFMLRMAKAETNDRLRSRKFLAFLRARFSARSRSPGEREEPRIIIP